MSQLAQLQGLAPTSGQVQNRLQGAAVASNSKMFRETNIKEQSRRTVETAHSPKLKYIVSKRY